VQFVPESSKNVRRGGDAQHQPDQAALRKAAEEEIAFKNRQRDRDLRKQALLQELAAQELAAKSYKAEDGYELLSEDDGADTARDKDRKKDSKKRKSHKDSKHKKDRHRHREGSSSSSRKDKKDRKKKKKKKSSSSKSSRDRSGRSRTRSFSESSSVSSGSSDSRAGRPRDIKRENTKVVGMDEGSDLHEGVKTSIADARRAAGLDWFTAAGNNPLQSKDNEGGEYSPHGTLAEPDDPTSTLGQHASTMQHKVPKAINQTPPLGDPNKLAAKAMRAKLKGDIALHDQLQKEIKILRAAQTGGVVAAATARAMHESDDAVLAPMDAQGRYLSSLASVQDHTVTSADVRKRKRGMYRDKEFEKHEEDMSVQEMLRREKQEVDMDSAYVENLLKRNRHDKMKYLEKNAREEDALETVEETKQAALYQSRKSRMTEMRAAEVDRQNAINAHRRAERGERSCPFSFQSPHFKKHLVAAIGEYAYLMLPVHPIAPGHVRIVPLDSVPAMTAASEGLRAEVAKFQAALERLYGTEDEPQSLVYMETVIDPDRLGWHTCIECIPVDEHEAEMVPIFFKKALAEAGEEWAATTHKTIDTQGRPVSSAIPPNFAYFHVAWGGGGYPPGGYAHRIEEPRLYKPEFGPDILRGIQGEAGLRFARKRVSESAERQRVAAFQKQWAKVDFIAASSSSTSSSSK